MGRLGRRGNAPSCHPSKAAGVLGFDTETRPSFRKGKNYTPSLIQIALPDEVFLFHLNWLPLGADLIGLLEDPRVIKTGVAARDDMRELAKLSPFTPHGVVDLDEVAAKNGIKTPGLRSLAAMFLGLRISKGEQCSNWGNKALSPRQIRYAATDAWVSRAIYFSMRNAGLRFPSDNGKSPSK
jgi:ribonuclease D